MTKITCTRIESKGKGRKRKKVYSGSLVRYDRDKVIIKTEKGDIKDFWINEITEYKGES